MIAGERRRRRRGARGRGARGRAPGCAQRRGKDRGIRKPGALPAELATQRARLDSLPAGGELRARLKAALAQSPLRPERLEPFIADVERARASGPLTREAVRGTALDAALDGLLFQDGNGRWTALIGLRATPSAPLDAAAVREAIARSGVTGAFSST